MNAQDAESRPRERREPGRGLGGGAAGAAGLDGTRAGRQEGRGRGTGRDRRGPALHATWGLRFYSERDEKL